MKTLRGPARMAAAARPIDSKAGARCAEPWKSNDSLAWRAEPNL